MIAAPASGSGKTTVTMGLIRALRRKGLDVCGYKVGPDYIDPAFLAAAAGKPAGNLDLHLQGERGAWAALAQADSAYCVIEGVMGFFDGIANTYQNSSYAISKLLGAPTVLIYTPKGEMFSAVPKIKGMADFADSTIRAVIFNNVSERYYRLLKDALEAHTPLRALGYVPKLPDAALDSRHLGLVQSVEIRDLDERLDRLAAEIAEHVDLSALIGLMEDVTIPAEAARLMTLRPRDLTVAVARDPAFSFYYRENLTLLERCVRVVYFSPLRDETLPACDLLYLGGGYPEVFNLQLAENTAMLCAIKAYADRGGCLYAECGGFMYLTESVDDTRMVGVFPGRTVLTDRLQRFGYIDLELTRDCFLGRAGTRLTGHEFHKSVSDVTGDTVYAIRKTLGERTWTCGYRYKNVIAGYPHLNFLGHPHALENMLEYAASVR